DEPPAAVGECGGRLPALRGHCSLECLADSDHVRSRRATRFGQSRKARCLLWLGPRRAIFLAADQRVYVVDPVTRAADGDGGPGRLAVLLDTSDPYPLAGLR